MIETIHHNGITAYCDGLRTQPSGHLAFLSLFGPQNATRGVWATLVGRRQGYVQVGQSYLRLDEAETYPTLRRPLDKTKDLHHLVMLHPSATNRISGMAESFIVLGEDPTTQWRTRFGRLCRVPVRKQWLDELWQRGLAADEPLIVPLEGFGMPAFAVNCETDKWHEVVKKILGVEA